MSVTVGGIDLEQNSEGWLRFEKIGSTRCVSHLVSASSVEHSSPGKADFSSLLCPRLIGVSVTFQEKHNRRNVIFIYLCITRASLQLQR